MKKIEASLDDLKKIRVPLARKISIVVLIMVVSSTTVIGVLSYYLHRRDSIAASADTACALANSVAAAIDGEQFQEILASGEKSQYWYDIKRHIDGVKTRTDIKYLYLLDKNHGETVKYFMEAAFPGETDIIDLGGEESAKVHADEMFETLSTGMPTTTGIYDTNEYGMMVSGFAPILDQNNKPVGVVGVDLNVDNVMRSVNTFGIEIILCVMVFSLGYWLTARWYIMRFVGKPIREISAASKKIAVGDMRVDLSVHSNDEIGELTASFQEMVDSTKKQISVLETLADGDLTAEITARSEQDTMGIAMKKTIDNLNSMFAEVNISTDHVSTGAGQIANAAQILAQEMPVSRR